MNQNQNKVLSKSSNYDILLMLDSYGAVAQLARASGSYPEGRGFESPRRYQCDKKLELFVSRVIDY